MTDTVIDLLFGLVVGALLGFLLGIRTMSDLAVRFAAGCAAATILSERVQAGEVTGE